jgi:Insertion element 4 transposase N-terminal
VGLDEAFECIAEVIPEDLKRFQRHIDPVWIEEALEATGTATVRRRRLPADQVVCMVLGDGAAAR